MDLDTRYLVDMVIAATRILERTQSMSRDDLDRDVSLQETVYWQTCVLGEAASHLSEHFRAKHPEEPWLRITGLRNRIIHGYGDVDHDVIWDVVRNHPPRLAALLTTIVSADEPRDDG